MSVAPRRTQPKPRYRSIADSALYLGVHQRTVRRKVATGELKAYRFGERGDIRIDQADLDALLTPVAGGDK